VSRSRRLNIVIVSSHGSRPWRLNLPRWVVPAAFVTMAAGVLSVGAIIGDYIRVREVARDPDALRRQLAEQRALVDSFRNRIAEVRLEVATWRDLHAKIWEPFGPDAGPSRQTKGIGGASAPGPEPQVMRRLSALEEVDRLADTVAEEGQHLRALERLMARAGRALALMPSRWPVRGAVNSEFGGRVSPWSRAREFHGGLDIAADRGTTVRAPAPGTVVYAGAQSEFGLTVTLDHGQEIRSLYGHLSKMLVSSGQRVERGQVIGLTGNTGRSSGPHLHYEILVKGHSVNPRAYLWD
jgi:murein DD-endopeptidase MepM/ murein hydrolase activator NlpD